MKRTFLLALALLAISFSHAQRFEWAKGYGTSYPQNGECRITGSVTDSLGNLYILGQFRNDSEWDGERLLPMTPYGDNINTLIAKISPSGEMVWKKVIHSNNGAGHIPNDIKKVGDSAFTCMVQMTLPTADHYTYYLDTLIPGMSDYPITAMYVEWPLRTALITFDFEGNVLEQHFLYVTFTDTAGNDYVKYYNNDPTPWYSSYHLQNSSFDIDNDGNIYISYEALNRIDSAINAQNGTIKGVKFWVDSTNVGHFTFENRPPMWYPQIVKFSPHFDTMLACRFVVQKSVDSVAYSLYDTRTLSDNNGNVYFKNILTILGNNNNIIIIDSSRNVTISHTSQHIDLSYLVKFDSNLIPSYAIFVQDSIIGNSPSSIRVMLHDITIDEDSNILFISGFAQKNTNSDLIYTVNGFPLPLEKNDAFIISFDANTGEYLSCVVIPSRKSSNLGLFDLKNNLFAMNNRLFMQYQYYGGTIFPNDTIQIGDYDAGLALAIFDYSGTIIKGIDYNVINSRSRPGTISLRDSLLYLSGELISDALFGEAPFLSNGIQNAFIALYIDTAFMSPYTGDTGNVSITFTPDVGAFTVYPNPFRQIVNIKVENTELKSVNGTVTAILTDITGRSEEVHLAPQGGGRYLLDLTARPQASYLLTLTTADGRQHTLHLLSQADSFGSR